MNFELNELALQIKIKFNKLLNQHQLLMVTNKNLTLENNRLKAELNEKNIEIEALKRTQLSNAINQAQLPEEDKMALRADLQKYINDIDNFINIIQNHEFTK
ncbi:MAG: hypothetical protein QM539_02815 [Alphaproteobacteria bacterium]|nr:hypothetical protein [Alphaproteobacteria bacterium]